MNTVERAKEIRKELKIKFPGVKFSVRTKKYSGGSSISISWVDFPTVEAVEEITSKYESVRYDEYTGEVLCGGNTFVFTNNSWSDEMKECIKENLIIKYGIKFYNECIENSYDGFRYEKEAYNELYKKSLEVAADTEEKEEPKAEDKKVLYSNEEIQIIEKGKTTRIYFNGKPSEEIRNSIKALGFRFFKNDGFYWGIYTNRTTFEAIKEALQVEDVEQVDDLETIIQHEQEYTNQVLKEELKEVEQLEVAEAKEEIKENKLQVIESKINESEDLTNAERCNNIYLEIEALEKRLKLVKSNKLKYKLQDQIDSKMKEIIKIILSDELLYMQFMNESKNKN